MKITIIEDEKLLQEELIFQLNKIEKIEVIQCLTTVYESIQWLTHHANEIDLIFMDIELADGVCFEIFESITIDTPIIFLTAYSEYAIQAFKVNSIDYLLKPVNPKELEFALHKFKSLTSPKNKIDLSILNDFYTKKEKITRVLIQSGDNFKYIDHNEIAYFIAEDKYTTVVSFDNKKHLINESLNKLEQCLPIHIFHRPSRKYIININAIVKATKYSNSRMKIFLEPSPKNELIISRNKVKEFLRWMGN